MLKQALILSHRWLGIPLSAFFVIWLVSGIVMIYTGGMPETTDRERLERAASLDLARVGLSPVEALAAADAGSTPSRVTLETVLERPVYRFGWFRGTTSVYADTGETLDALDIDTTRRIAAAFADVPETAVRFVREVTTADQWTLLLRDDLPLHRFDVADGAGTQLYVSPHMGTVSLATTRATRALAWAGAIPHWFYFTPLRVNQPLWYWGVVWVSAIGSVLAVFGLVLGVVQTLPARDGRRPASSRYRSWMRWHYLTGIVFGLFVLTWVFSGMMSMEPFTLSSSAGVDVPRNVLTGGPLELERYDVARPSEWAQVLDTATLKRIELVRRQDAPYFIAHTSPSRDAAPALIAAATLKPRERPFSVESIVERVRGALDGVPIVAQELLDSYDAYYYSRDGAAPLPVLRVKLGDPDGSWYYFDPGMSEMVYRVHSGGRWQRWLFNGLHSLDFAFWYDKRPLWDIGMIALSLGALATSLVGAYLGLKRLRRDFRRLTGRGATAPG